MIGQFLLFTKISLPDVRCTSIAAITTQYPRARGAAMELTKSSIRTGISGKLPTAIKFYTVIVTMVTMFTLRCIIRSLVK